jgi:hypothetical protein
VRFKNYCLKKLKKNQPPLDYNLSTNREKPKPITTMKKFLYVLLMIMSTAVTLSSCTEEEVKPNIDLGTGSEGGGYGHDEVKK